MAPTFVSNLKQTKVKKKSKSSPWMRAMERTSQRKGYGLIGAILYLLDFELMIRYVRWVSW